VLQAFALRALQRSAGLGDAERVRGWLARILATSMADYQRSTGKVRRREVAFDDEDPDHGGAAPTPEDEDAVCACLHKVLPTVRPEYAEVVRRVDLRGESRDQIAADLGKTVNSVAVRLYRGRIALKKRLEQTCSSCPEHGFFHCYCESRP
jgi:DNA-directed RNA polymerase specialized sigma24 family protein